MFSKGMVSCHERVFLEMGKRYGVSVAGACGRMGIEVLYLIGKSPILFLSGAIERKGHRDVGRDVSEVTAGAVSGIKITDNIDEVLSNTKVLLDFTSPPAISQFLPFCIEKGVAVVSGSTGLTDKDREEIITASKFIPILHSVNMSMGVNLLCKLVKTASESTPKDFSVSIIEFHHKEKKDAPSGTARMIGEIITQTRGEGEVDILSLRGGTITGEHRVIFAGEGERLEILHIAERRSIFALGAIRAVEFILDKTPGLYTMDDLLYSKR